LTLTSAYLTTLVAVWFTWIALGQPRDDLLYGTAACALIVTATAWISVQP
jgi:hypothetical protein